ncbi:MAG: PEGA domain-containing protein [Acidobacteria bacterium]|nr:MAG: PEGA domain-containing protein [Acidobacteriota bacterium]
MSSYAIEDGRGRRAVTAGDFPLTVGGREADVEVDPAAGVVAYLGLAGGEVFVQPAEGRRVRHDGVPLTASQWLRDGDVLELAGGRLVVKADGGGLRFVAERRAPATDEGTTGIRLTPPPHPPAAGALIRPIPFTPRRRPTAGRRRRGPRPARVAAALLLVALAAGAAFVFTARAVEITIEPPPDRLYLDGALPGVELAGRRLLWPGRYALVAEKDGYRRLETSFEVGREPRQSFRFALTKLPGRLVIEAPGDAEVRIDGELAGRAPLAPLELAPGEHRVEVRSGGYLPFFTTVTIAGGGVSQRLIAELTPHWAPVRFASEPPGASVRIDGRELGRTPLAVDLAAGRHAYELVLAGFEPYRGRVRVEAGRPQSLPPVRLQPAAGILHLLTTPPAAAVSVDGEYRGETPLELRLTPEVRHRLRLSKAGYDGIEREIEVRPGERRRLSLELDAAEGRVRLTVYPPDAAVVVDGERRGRGSQVLALSAVPHVIEVEKAGYEGYRRSLTPLPGVLQALEVRLKSLEEVKAERTPPLLEVAGHRLKRIDPGPLTLGASRREPGRRANEVLRRVELVRPFYLGLHEVTNAQFRHFAPDHRSGAAGGHSLEHDDHPVVRVTWQQAAAYCNWLSAQEGLPPAYVERDGKLVAAQPLTTGYRLPTEAEWAWAARYEAAAAARKFPWGDALPVAPGSGNYADRSAARILPAVLGDYDDGFPTTAPVSRFGPDAAGFFNLGGNVAEWVHDAYAIRPPAGPEPERDPTGPAAGELHVIRGSSWMHSTVTELRLSFRDYGKDGRPDVGFRIARYVE